MNIHVRQTAASTSEATIRGHKVAIDRPLGKDGADAGPMGGELFLAAIGGCFMSNLLAAINARHAQVSAVQTEVTAMLAEAPSRFTAVDLCVSAECADRELFEKLVEIAERGCIMLNTLKGKLDLQVRIGTLA